MSRSALLLLPLALLGTAFLGGCGGGTQVERTDSDEVIDLSGNWNDTDSQQVAAAMIADVMNRPWHSNFRTQENRNPVVKVGDVYVRSNGDVIDTDIFTKDITREFVNSGLVDAVRARGEESQIRDERVDQDRNASNDTRKRNRQELGADYLMTGAIKVQDDREGRQAVKFYSVDLQLEDIESGRLVWVGNKKIKKKVTRAR